MALLKMCDEKLDTLPEGIVARLSALEEKLAALTANGFTPTAGKVTPGENVMLKRSVKPEEVKAPSMPSDTKKAVRSSPKPVTWWIEAAKRVGEKNPSVFPFMKLSRAYESENGINVYVEGEIGMMMLDTPEMRRTLSELSAALSGSPVPESAFKFIQTGPQDIQKPIDDLPDET